MKFKITIDFSNGTQLITEKRLSPIPSDRNGWRRANQLKYNFWDLKMVVGENIVVGVQRIEIEKLPE